MHFEIVSENDGFLDGIGLLEAGKPHVVTEEELLQFNVRHGYRLTEAKFPSWVNVTAVTITEGGE